MTDTGATDLVDDDARREVPPGASPSQGRWQSSRSVLARAWFPDPAGGSDPAVVVAVVAAALTALAFFRVPWPYSAQRVWAEDGRIFLEDAASRGFGSTFFSSYAGYMHSVPRTLAAIVTLLPGVDRGAGVTVATAVVVGLAGVFTYVVMRDLTGRRWMGLAAAIYLVAAPVGAETIGNMANLQWRLLPAALLAALWTPRRTGGVVVAAVVILAATTSSPFGVLVVVVVLVRLLLKFSRTSAIIAAAAVLGTVVQGIVILRAPDARQLFAVPGPYEMAQRYLLRVVGNGVFGEQLLGRLPTVTALHVGELTGAIIVALLLIAVVTGGRDAALRIVAFGLISLAVFVAPMAINAPPFEYSYATRYYLAPAIFLMLTLLVGTAPRLIGTAPRTVGSTPRLLGRRSDTAASATHAGETWSDRPPRRAEPTSSGNARRWLPAPAVAAVVMVAVALANLELPGEFPYRPIVRWDQQVTAASSQCGADPSRTVTIPLNPGGWEANLTCRQLR